MKLTSRFTLHAFSQRLIRLWRTRIIFSLAALLLLASCSLDSGYSQRQVKSSQNVSQKIAAKKTKASSKQQEQVAVWRPTKQDSIPFTNNAKVKQWINSFNGPLKPNFTRWISRLGQYGPTIEKILKEEGVPKDLIYLAMIESGFNMQAISSASAAGPWQFISSTGKMYGLDNSFFVDDRSNFEDATRAAAKHLKDLYNVYGDWYLAFAAYNAGPGKVNSAIKRSKSKDYWVLASRKSRSLRQETKDYVPKILAAMYIVKNYRKFGYTEKSFGDPLEFDKVTVPDATDIHVLAKSANTSVDVIQALNPSLVRGITPPGEACNIFIPKGAKEEFQKNYARIPASQRVSNLQYRVESGETITEIAKKFHLTSAQIAKQNSFTDKQQSLSPGQIIYVPATKSSLSAMRRLNAVSANSVRTHNETFTYKVKSGETLRSVAKKNRTTVSSLARWNGLKKTSKLKIGQSLKIVKKVKEKSSGTTFIATNTTGRVSGVDHIIMQNGLNESAIQNDAQTEEDTKIDIPEMVAMTEDESLSETEDLPVLIKTQNQEPNTILSTQTTQATLVTTVKPPMTASNTATPKQKLQTKYTVKPGDTLFKIAQRNHVTIAQVKSWNNLKSNMVRLGQKLQVSAPITQLAAATDPAPTMAVATAPAPAPAPTPTTTATVTPTPTATATVIFHKVQSGETLWSLSRKYNVKVSDIMKWNKLKNQRVQANQKIRIVQSQENQT